ncbi:MAG: crosslink repair DNA glycosylase YcaQ family protein [Maribacter sp.]|uniref:winged helix-turn-helix domain-containing protein n=1 Tax=Maribacter sp. TaxID=1897614 RepID=UPI003C756F4F
MSNSIPSISLKQVCKLVLLSQRIPPTHQKGNALAATLATIEHLGYIQIDTISTIARAHHHTLWNRNPRYKNEHLGELMANKSIFEYWSHAAAYLPMKEYRFSLPRKMAIASGEQRHWYAKDKKLMQRVLDRIAAQGPLMAKDFENKGKKLGDWQTKPAKKALENLYMQGKLMIRSRQNFHKVYDLTERVLPNAINTSMPTPDEYAQFLITSFLRAHGIAKANEMGYLLKNMKTHIDSALNDLCVQGKVQPLMVGNEVYYALTTSLELLNRPLMRSKCKIVSPFDNLIIQRKRISDLFGFDYVLECYVPEAKRKYGYFVLPILWNGKFVARMDCKADRKTSVLHVHQMFMEQNTVRMDNFLAAFVKELDAFMKFNACTRINVHKSNPDSIKMELSRYFESS